MFDDYIVGFIFFLIFLIFMGLPVALAAYISRLRHIERMAMIEKGMDIRPPKRSNGKDTLRWGIVISALGLAITISLYPLGFLSARSTFPLHFGPWMGIGLLPLFFGLGLILAHYLIKENREKNELVDSEEKENKK